MEIHKEKRYNFNVWSTQQIEHFGGKNDSENDDS